MLRESFILFMSILMLLTACNSIPESVIDDAIENTKEVSTYHQHLVYNYETISEDREVVQLAGKVDAYIDLDVQQGYVHFIEQSHEEDVEYQFYFEGKDVYENIAENLHEGWVDANLSVEEVHALYFTDYRDVSGILQLMSSKKASSFEEVEGLYEITFMESEEEAEQIVNELGIHLFDEERVMDAELVLGIDEETMDLTTFHINYRSEIAGENTSNELTMEYSDINANEAIEKPEEISNLK